MAELKPCPWCGSEPRVLQYGNSGVISCMNHKCKMAPQTPLKQNVAELVYIWNNREDGKGV